MSKTYYITSAGNPHGSTYYEKKMTAKEVQEYKKDNSIFVTDSLLAMLYYIND